MKTQAVNSRCLLLRTQQGPPLHPFPEMWRLLSVAMVHRSSHTLSVREELLKSRLFHCLLKARMQAESQIPPAHWLNWRQRRCKGSLQSTVALRVASWTHHCRLWIRLSGSVDCRGKAGLMAWPSAVSNRLHGHTLLMCPNLSLCICEGRASSSFVRCSSIKGSASVRFFGRALLLRVAWALAFSKLSVCIVVAL